ncbi:MAG: hypothetical protein A2X24_12960 [Chloroflexi bacterium GWB2_54_36]|nr:MAG: hypothetical protein A2X24_12960 [Chloroflexi bacterium GWB2_54_36]
MNNIVKFRELFAQTTDYHNNLVNLTRAISKIQDLFSFIILCIDFAEKYIPKENLTKWSETNESIPLLFDRMENLITLPPLDALTRSVTVINTSGSASSDSFAFLLDNYPYLETEKERTEFRDLTQKYKNLLLADENRGEVINYLSSLNQVAAYKFTAGSNQLHSLGPDEDAEGPLMMLRSALDLAVNSLIEKIGLTNKEIAEIKRAEVIPLLANHLAKDESSKIDLILMNKAYTDLYPKLSAAKNNIVDRDRAIGLALEVTAILNLISRTLR